MSTELATRTESQQMTVLSNEQLQYIAGTEFVPPGLRGNLPAILACVATGRALGIADMTALRSIHVIDGKATFSAELMVMLARRAGHSIIGDVTAGQATAHGKRGDNGDTMTVDWTLEMADRAGLLGKSNWKKYPEAMLWARAASQLCRMLFADCFAGATYTTEELGADETDPNGAPYGDSAAGTPFSYDHEEPLDPPLEQVLAAHAASDASPSSPALEAAPKPTVPQLKKLNVLIGQLRDQHGLITTKHLYVSVGRELPEGVADTDLRWSPLRDSLTRQEASALIDRLENFANERVPS